jgi:hypothetical protein
VNANGGDHSDAAVVIDSTTGLRDVPQRETREFWTLFTTDAAVLYDNRTEKRAAPSTEAIARARALDWSYLSMDVDETDLRKGELRLARDIAIKQIFHHLDGYHAELTGIHTQEELSAALVSPTKTIVLLGRIYERLSHEWVQSVEACRKKDDVRGRRIMADYDTSHVTASDDEVVVNERRRTTFKIQLSKMKVDLVSC